MPAFVMGKWPVFELGVRFRVCLYVSVCPWELCSLLCCLRARNSVLLASVVVSPPAGCIQRLSDQFRCAALLTITRTCSVGTLAD